MNNLNLKVVGNSYHNAKISIDGKNVKLKKNRTGVEELNFQTESSKVEVCVYKYLEIKTKFWFLWSLVYFITSLFGVFDSGYDKKCRVLDCKVKVDLNEQTEVTLRLDHKESDNVMTVETQKSYEVLENTCYVDSVAKKRMKLLKAFKIIFWLALIVVLAVVLIK